MLSYSSCSARRIIVLSQMRTASKESLFSRQKMAFVALCVVTQQGDHDVKEIVW